MTSQVSQRQASLMERVAAGARRVNGRLDVVLFRGQLGPTRDSERRDFNPGRRI